MCSDCKTGFNMFLLLFNCCLCLALKILPDWSNFTKSLQNLLKNRNIKNSTFLYCGFLSVKNNMTGRQHIVEATFIFLLVEIEFPTFLKASQYLNINSVLKMHKNYFQSIIIVFYTSCQEFMASTYYYVLRT
jgi:hypothetical protein